MSAVLSHDFETQRSRSNEIAASNVTHSRRKRSGGRYQEKEKGEVHRRARRRRRKCDVSVPSPLHHPRPRRLRPTGVSVRRQFPPRLRRVSIVAHLLPTESRRCTFTMCITSHLSTVSYPSPSPPLPRATGNSEIHERENRTYLKASLCQNQLPKAATKLRYIETRRSAGMFFFYQNEKFGKNNRQGDCSSSGTPLVKDSHRS